MHIRAARRAIRSKGAILPIAICGVAMVALFATTMGAVVVNDALPAFWQAILPEALGGAPMIGGLALFLGGSAGIAVAVYITAAIAIRTRRVQSPVQP